MQKEKIQKNEFSKFFNSSDYITLKNQLFNYKFRKYMLYKAYKKYNSQKNEKILDVGCGISPVSPDFDKTIFIETDKTAVSLLKKQGYNAIVGKVEKIPLKKDYADSIFSSEVLEHVFNYKKGLNEFNRLLKKKGLLFITVPTYMKYWAFDDEYVGHLRRFDPIKFANDIKNSGFEILENKPIGSFIERELTKFLVKRVINSGNKQNKMNKLKLTAFSWINKLLFVIIYCAYIINNKNNSSIVMIVARKK